MLLDTEPKPNPLIKVMLKFLYYGLLTIVLRASVNMTNIYAL